MDGEKKEGARHEWIWLKIIVMARKGWKWLTMAGNSCIWFELANKYGWKWL